MDPLTISLIAGGVLGAMKGQQNEKNWREQQQIEATKERWAPFTGRRGQNQARPNSMDPLMQGLVSGALIGNQLTPEAAAVVPASGVEGTSAFIGPPSAANMGNQAFVPHVGGGAALAGPPRAAMMGAPGFNPYVVQSPGAASPRSQFLVNR